MMHPSSSALHVLEIRVCCGGEASSLGGAGEGEDGFGILAAAER